MNERIPEEDAVAKVLFGWLISHGYTIKDARGHILVPTDQIREDLVKIRSDNPSKGNTTEGRRWNRAVEVMFGLISYYEQTALSSILTSAPADDAQYRDLLGCIWLYVDWRYVTTQLTVEQKELWADAVDAFGEPSERRWKADRWWRE